VGAGGIVQHGHMPAYRKAGLRVVGIASRREGSVRPAADRWGIPHAFTDWRRLLDLPEVTVVDVTYPFDEERLEIVRAAAERGQHILMQKPLAHSREAAHEMVAIARRHGVRLAVNQNARWCPPYRAVRMALEAGLLGDVYFLAHELESNQDSQAWWQQRWYSQQTRFQLLEYAVHHVDVIRFWAGVEPVRVTASLGRKPGQFAKGDMLGAITLEFPNKALAVLIENNATYAKTPVFARFRVEGTRGLAWGEGMGPAGVTVQSDLLEPGEHKPALAGNWFPDAFAGTMGELLCAIEENREPSISGEDNLKTLEIILRAYESAGG
jgi:predicted dehydrogenase